MKKILLFSACFIFCSLFFCFETMAQTQEKSIPEYDDLAPFPYEGDKPVEKKGIGQKIKEGFKNDQKAYEEKSKEKISEDPIRFYEFEDITFADEKEEPPVKETVTTGEFGWVKEESNNSNEYYKDVTFADEEIEFEDEKIYDDATFGTPKEEKKYWKTEEEVKKSERPKTDRSAKPIEMKDKDFYRQDYIRYYYNRKKKGNGEPGTYPDYTKERTEAKYKILERMEGRNNE